jgi:hypothetical protein
MNTESVVTPTLQAGEQPIESLSAPTSLIGNEAYRPGGSGGRTKCARPSWNRSSNRVPQATSLAQPVPVQTSRDQGQPSAKPTGVWEINPGSGPIIDQTSLIVTSQTSVMTPIPTSVATSVSPANAVVTSRSTAVAAPPAPSSGSGSGGKAGLAVNSESGNAWSSWAGGDISWYV